MVITVEKLIELLQECDNKQARVELEVANSDGCDTCGYGHSTSEIDLTRVVDLDTHVVLSGL